MVNAMKAIIYAVVTVALTSNIMQRSAMAQTVPSPDRLQQFSRDLTPSSAQDFFRAGQAQMEQEIRWLWEQRLAHLNTILQVQSVTLPKEGELSPAPFPTKPTKLPAQS